MDQDLAMANIPRTKLQYRAKILVLLVVIVIIALSISVSAPALAAAKREQNGFVYNQRDNQNEGKDVTIEVYMDMSCPDSKRVFPTLKVLADDYGSQVKLIMYMFPLPFHRASFLASQGSFIFQNYDDSKAYDWMKVVFDNQNLIYNSATKKLNDEQVVGILSDLAEKAGMPGLEYTKHALSSSDKSIYQAIVQWKSGCTRGVSGTPFTYINGALVNAESTWSLADWKAVIDPLL